MDSGDARKLTRAAQDTIRRKSVKAVVEGKMSQTEAAMFFGATRTSVCLWAELSVWRRRLRTNQSWWASWEASCAVGSVIRPKWKTILR